MTSSVAQPDAPATSATWKSSACILCECNCGIEVQLGGAQGRELVKIRGDRQHPASQGYTCEKPRRLNYYQNANDRIDTPLRRRDDGSFEPISWDLAISEIAQRLGSLRDEHGGESIFYYGGGGQGNHLPGAYAGATRRALGSRYKSSALAQEKTGEFWINERMIGGMTRADFEHCEVGLFIGKNPWYSHSIQRARVVLKQIAKDPERCLIVIDPRVTKTAELADIHLQVRPGCDAWLLSGLLAAIVQEDLIDHAFVAAHTEGSAAVLKALEGVSVAEHCEHAGVAEDLVRTAARRIAGASSVASIEDLGVQMNRHSTFVSYLHKLLVLLTGNLGKPGTHYIPSQLVNFASGKVRHRSPVVDAPLVGGLVPCNVIAAEILADHPKRYRAMIVEATNPAHSLADSKQFREAMGALDTLVVIDVAMTETAELADYVLPASSQYEKAEATFFNFEFPENYFHLRPALLAPLAGTLPEAEIHARLCEALGAFTQEELAPLHAAAAKGLQAYGQAFMQVVIPNPRLSAQAPVILYRTLGPVLPEGLAEGALLFGIAARFGMKGGAALARAGFEGPPQQVIGALFNAMIKQASGFVFSVETWDEVLGRMGTATGKAQLELQDMLAVLSELGAPQPPAGAQDFPFVLSAGERRSHTANTILRDPQWREKDENGALRMHPQDGERLGIANGDQAVLVTASGRASVWVAHTSSMQPGHVSLPNGRGLKYPAEAPQGTPGGVAASGRDMGVAPNELTRAGDCDPFVATPWHKFVPARVEALPPG